MRRRGAGNLYRLARSLNVTSEGNRLMLAWRDRATGRDLFSIAGPDELLGLKIVTERLPLAVLARETGQPLSRFYRLLSWLDRRGILDAPATLLRRDEALFGPALTDDRLTVTTMGLQWHITQACDLHCRHCYDRSPRQPITETEALKVLDGFEVFCREHWCSGSISFTGGNPFLYRGFLELYAEAVRRGFEVDILGNPVERNRLEEVCRRQSPSMYQVSLEGRRPRNDAVRGSGSYDRAIAFLGMLREMGVPSVVMLTLTRFNLHEVLPLARLLEARTNGFTFSRLSRTGRGAALDQPDSVRFRRFLHQWVRYRDDSRIASDKDNLVNLVLEEQSQPLHGGCTGFGCGAAFNGFDVLPDGEVYACRKFPSPIGNALRQTFDEIWYSPEAALYRRGLKACDGCTIRHACGGCMAACDRSERLEDTRDTMCWRTCAGPGDGFQSECHVGALRHKAKSPLDGE